MFQCSSSSGVCLITFLFETAAAASVETLFPKSSIAELLGQATRGCSAGWCSGRRYTVLGYRRRVKRAKGGGGTETPSARKGTNRTKMHSKRVFSRRLMRLATAISSKVIAWGRLMSPSKTWGAEYPSSYRIRVRSIVFEMKGARI